MSSPFYTIVYADIATGHEIACFWNPRPRIRMCFLRYERGHPLYPRFIKFLRSFWMCVSCKGSSIRPGYSRTQNIILEAQACEEISFQEYRMWKTDNEQYKAIEKLERALEGRCHHCVDMFYEGIDRDITGVEFFSVEEKSYCCVFRGTMEELLSGERKICKCYTEEDNLDFYGYTGKLVKCE